MKVLIRNLILTLVSIVTTLLCVEGFLKWRMPLSIGEINLQEDFQLSENPNLIYEPRPSTGEFNSDGLRDYEHSLEKSENVYRVVVIGDSLAYGFGVKLEETYTKKLEQKLNGQSNKSVQYEVINLGVPSYRTTQIVERLKEKGLKYRPDLIIYGYWLDDVTESGTPVSLWLDGIVKGGTSAVLLNPANNVLDRKLKDLMFTRGLRHKVAKNLLKWQIVRRLIIVLKRAKHEKEETRLFSLEGKTENLDRGGADLYKKYTENYLAGRLVDKRGFEPYYEEYANPDNFLLWNSAMKELSVICHQGKIKCLLLMTPVFYDREGESYHWHPLHMFIRSMAAHYSIPILDLEKQLGTYKVSEVRLGIGDPEHPNRLGHEIIANETFNFLTTQKQFLDD